MWEIFYRKITKQGSRKLIRVGENLKKFIIMQFKQAQDLRERWGDRPCEHLSFEKEYYLGADTSDFICTQCGREFTETEKEEIERRRHENDKE